MSNETKYELRILDSGNISSKEVFKSLLNEEGTLEYDRFFPTPKDLFFNDNDITPEILKALEEGQYNPANLMSLTFKIKDKVHKEKAKSYIHRFIRDNKKNYGFKDCYEWRYENWGTYNNPDQRDKFNFNKDDHISFIDNYIMKEELWKKLSEVFPDVRFELRYANERLGLNCGVLELHNGKISHIEKSACYMDSNPSNNPHFNQMAANMWYPEETPNELGFDKNWNPIEEN